MTTVLSTDCAWPDAAPHAAEEVFRVLRGEPARPPCNGPADR